jgi:hypothetical protein
LNLAGDGGHARIAGFRQGDSACRINPDVPAKGGLVSPCVGLALNNRRVNVPRTGRSNGVVGKAEAPQRGNMICLLVGSNALQDADDLDTREVGVELECLDIFVNRIAIPQFRGGKQRLNAA